MDKKVCKDCNVEKELNNFHKASKCKFGVKSRCNECTREYKKNKNIEYKPNALKICTCCNVEKKTSEFYKNSGCKYGVDSKCKDCRIKYDKKHYINNKESINKKTIARQKNRKKNDHIYKLTCNIRGLIRQSFKRRGFSKNTKNAFIIGCSFEELKNHIESQFEPWMNWDNHGKYNGDFNYGWDIDHIIPLASAKTEEDLIKLNHYTNLQPLCSKVNRVIKKDKIM